MTKKENEISPDFIGDNPEEMESGTICPMEQTKSVEEGWRRRPNKIVCDCDLCRARYNPIIELAIKSAREDEREKYKKKIKKLEYEIKQLGYERKEADER